MLSVPQVVRLLVGRTSAGVSLLLWQLLLGAGIGWTIHGVVSGHLNLVVPNVISVLLSTAVLAMIARDRRLPAGRVWPLGLAVATGWPPSSLWAGRPHSAPSSSSRW